MKPPMDKFPTGRRGARKYWVVFLKGIAMGAADSVPGVSGGTIAVITRIYDELICSIRSVNLVAIGVLFRQGPRTAWAYINGNFLLALLAGILLSLRISAAFVLSILNDFFEPVMAFFIGLVLASCWLLRGEMGPLRPMVLLTLTVGVLLTVGVGSIAPLRGAEISSGYLFLCGLVAICAMILPGISGAFLLLVLGVYDYVLTALVEFDVSRILVFGGGCIIGLLAFSRFLAWMLRGYRELAYGFLNGMLAASVYILWPWQQAVSFYQDRSGMLVPLEKQLVLPHHYEQLTGQDPRLLAVVMFCLLGVSLVLVLEKLFRGSVD